MSIAHLLENFGAYTKKNEPESVEVLTEDERLDAFENGYQAGWDDAVKAKNQEADSIAAEFDQTLRDLSFTYHEAYTGILNGLRPLLTQMVEVVLPQVARQTLGQRVSDLLYELLSEHGRLPVELLVAPDDHAAIEHLAQEQTVLPVTVVKDAHVGPGQIRIRFGEVAERELDLTAVLGGISEALTAFYETDLTEYKETA